MIPQSTITTIKTMAKGLREIEPKANSSTVFLAQKKARTHERLISEIQQKGQKQ